MIAFGDDKDRVYEAIFEHLENVSDDDYADCRTNPVAYDEHTGRLVTAHEVALMQHGEADEEEGEDEQSGHFVHSAEAEAGEKRGKSYRVIPAHRYTCPTCVGVMFYRSRLSTPFFAHRSGCKRCAGRERPAHFLMKRGMRAIGWTNEHRSECGSFQYDAFDPVMGTVLEVVSSGSDRYFKKIDHLDAVGVPQMWLLDSAAPALASRFGSESYDVKAAADGRVIVRNLFGSKARRLMERIGHERLYTFYAGLPWHAIAFDAWELLDEKHFLTVAATCDGGIKNLMVAMHQSNAQHIIDVERKTGHKPRTWFDRKFRYRGKWTTTWNGDRDYVLEMIEELRQKAARDAEREMAREQRGSGSSTPSEPRHRTLDEVAQRMSEQHAKSAAANRLGDNEAADAMKSIVDATQAAAEVVAAPAVLTTATVTIPGADVPRVVPVVVAAPRVIMNEPQPEAAANGRIDPTFQTPPTPVAAPAAAPASVPGHVAAVLFRKPTNDVVVTIAEASTVSGGVIPLRVRLDGDPSEGRTLYHGQFTDALSFLPLCRASGHAPSEVVADPSLLVGTRVVCDYVRRGTGYFGPDNWRPAAPSDDDAAAK